MKINVNRFWENLMDLGQITEPDKPYTRRSFSSMFVKGRKWLKEKMEAAGLQVSVDASGNLIGKLEGTSAGSGSILVGSHSDTVPSGGRFDGVAGVVAAIECAHSIKDAGIRLEHNLEIIDYLAEEPSEWGISCVGSRGISGYLSSEHLGLVNPNSNEILSDAIDRIGGDVSKLSAREDVFCALEVHIEQGLVLEQKALNIGVVSGIVGIIRLKLVLEGQPNHAGNTPMSMRYDSLTAASKVIVEAERMANIISKNDEGYFVATCGQIFNYPNASNVIPGRTEIVFDIRSDKREWMDTFADDLVAYVNGMDVRLVSHERLTDTHPVKCNSSLMNLFEESCRDLGYSFQVMPSGAGHDTAFLTHIAPAAMIFVPCVEGKSHCPEEWTEKDDMVRGVEILYKTIISADKHKNLRRDDV